MSRLHQKGQTYKGVIGAELSLKTKEGKTPNCSDCDMPSYFRFGNTRVPNFFWRKCARHMNEEEREAVRAYVVYVQDLNM